MAAIPGAVDTERAPPMTIPLRHFLVGLGFLLFGAAVGATSGLGWDVGAHVLANVHLLLAGWVCVTIMGAMTQFVPVWSGVALHSQRFAVAQLRLVAVGLVGFAGALLFGAFEWLPVGGALVLAGFWLFAYNVGRTLLSARPWDVTERHFALALGFFVLLTALGFSLAVGLTRPVFSGVRVGHGDVRMAHATLAVFGAVMTTVIGALYQLATMFTQTEIDGIDHRIQRFESVGYPVGVLGLAGGRLFGIAPLAGAGGLVVAGSILGVGVILARRLQETRVEQTPMLSRYAVAAGAMILWAVLSAPAWVVGPLAPEHLYGASGTVHLLTLGIIGFVVFGTLYHVVPFIVWVHRYSDLLGLEEVPMIDDLYDDRIAAADFGLLSVGATGLVLVDLLAIPAVVRPVFGGSILVGSTLFAANMWFVLRRHGPGSVVAVFRGQASG